MLFAAVRCTVAHLNNRPAERSGHWEQLAGAEVLTPSDGAENAHASSGCPTTRPPLGARLVQCDSLQLDRASPVARLMGLKGGAQSRVIDGVPPRVSALFSTKAHRHTAKVWRQKQQVASCER